MGVLAPHDRAVSRLSEPSQHEVLFRDDDDDNADYYIGERQTLGGESRGVGRRLCWNFAAFSWSGAGGRRGRSSKSRRTSGCVFRVMMRCVFVFLRQRFEDSIILHGQ